MVIRFRETCEHLSDMIGGAMNHVTALLEMAPRFDFDEKTPGNGFR